jgi:hypothetical protein
MDWVTIKRPWVTTYNRAVGAVRLFVDQRPQACYQT